MAKNSGIRDNTNQVSTIKQQKHGQKSGIRDNTNQESTIELSHGQRSGIRDKTNQELMIELNLDKNDQKPGICDKKIGRQP